ncbi:DUF6083 domain-containing protein (plasmid) [Streptomyces sp. SDT5-1]|uniref:DUF6083 domain-containing protein n=1 Tax=Streptomyces sp. SDT5-1 TaxID=3406418 RepID=UPI003FD461C1
MPVHDPILLLFERDGTVTRPRSKGAIAQRLLCRKTADTGGRSGTVGHMRGDACGLWDQCLTCQMAVQRHPTPQAGEIVLDPRPVAAEAIPEDLRWHVRADGLAIPLGWREAEDDLVRVEHAAACHGSDPRLAGVRHRFASDEPPQDVDLLLPPRLPAFCDAQALREELRASPPRDHVLGVACPTCRAFRSELCHEDGAVRTANHRERMSLYRRLRHRILPPTGPRSSDARDVACPTCRSAAGRPCLDGDGRALGRAHAERTRRSAYGPWPAPVRRAPTPPPPPAPAIDEGPMPRMTTDPVRAVADLKAAARAGAVRHRQALNQSRNRGSSTR